MYFTNFWNAFSFILQRPLIFTLALPHPTFPLFTHTHIWQNASVLFL